MIFFHPGGFNDFWKFAHLDLVKLLHSEGQQPDYQNVEQALA